MRGLLWSVIAIMVLTVGCSGTTEGYDQATASIEESKVNGPSPEFSSGAYSLRGIEGRLGLSKLNGDTQDVSFTAGEGNLFQWHFWGPLEDLQGKVKVVAISEETGHESVIAEGEPAETGHGMSGNESDAHIAYKMALPTEDTGLWTLNVFIGDELFDGIVIEQKE